MRLGSGRSGLARFAAVVVTLVTAATTAAARPEAVPAGWDRLSTPNRILAAERAGRIDSTTATLYLARAMTRPDRLPEIYRGTAPWHGTVHALRVQEALEHMPDGPEAAEIRAITMPAAAPGPGGIGLGTCYAFATPMPNTRQTAHFYIEYSDAVLSLTPDGLDIDDYAASLEGAWAKQVTEFGWAPPPVAPVPAPGGKYHVRIDVLPFGLYGLVSSLGTHAGPVGDNPNTTWHDTDADASCMVLNADYTLFPSSPQASLDATTAHEFNHSLQYGLGALRGANRPDPIFVEGGASWMEDEVYDHADDNYWYLWPQFDGSMGEYPGNADNPYGYWITFRGLTERFGTGVAGGAEQVMQDFWEETSRNTGNNLTAMQAALANKGSTLADAFHDYAIAVKFNRTCGGGYVYPHCFEEAAGYVDRADQTAPHGAISAVGGAFSGRVADYYAIAWVRLAVSGTRTIRLANTSTGGQMRGSIVCDTGSSLTITSLPSIAGPGQSAQVTVAVDDCILVVTNQAQAVANPGSATARTYTATVVS